MSFVLCVCLVFVVLSRLFVAALWSPAGGGGGGGWPLGSFLCCLIVILSLSHVGSWVGCGT